MTLLVRRVHLLVPLVSSEQTVIVSLEISTYVEGVRGLWCVFKVVRKAIYEPKSMNETS